MNKTVIASSVFFVVGLGLAGLVLANPYAWNWARDLQQRLGVSAPAPGESMADMTGEDSEGEREILYWRAPMDPNYIRDEPGLSPMGMELIPVYADEINDIEGFVRIDPGFVQNIGVRSVEVSRTDLPHTIRTIGTFAYDDSQVFWINTKFEGWIENVEVNYIGQEVQAGQRLFDVFSPQLVSTQKEYIDAVRYLERLEGTDYPEAVGRARALVESARQRLRYWDIGEAQIAELARAGEPRRTLTVTSPVTGVVVSKMDQALEGMLARPGMNLYKIADLSTIWIEAEVYENEIPWLRVGQQAAIEVPNQPGRRYTGTIRYLYPFLNQSTRTLKLSIELPNPGRELRADMYANVVLDVPSRAGILAVPEEAVLRSGERNVLIVSLGEGRFQVRDVALGVNGNGLWEVRDGVAEGDRVVVSSQFLIDSESNLREAVRKLASPPPPPESGTGAMTGMNVDPGEAEAESANPGH